MEQSVVSVSFPKEEFDLEADLKANRHLSNKFGINSNYGRSYQVWGIEIGRRFLAKVFDGDTALDAVARLKCLLRMGIDVPSHFIVREWSSNDISGDNERYTVYRLSQKQEADVKRYVDIRARVYENVTVEPMPSYLNHREGHNFFSEIQYGGWELSGSGVTEEEAKEDVIRRWCKVVQPVQSA